MTELQGGCACGAVRYRLTSAPMFIQCCHCVDCQRQVGSAFVVNAMIETDRIEVASGDLRAWRMPTDSGGIHDVYRCTACGTAMWSDYGGRASLRFFRATTLDDRGALPPQAHIFTRAKLAWVILPADVPAFDIYYDIAKLWPTDSLERRRALLGDV